MGVADGALSTPVYLRYTSAITIAKWLLTAAIKIVFFIKTFLLSIKLWLTNYIALAEERISSPVLAPKKRDERCMLISVYKNINKTQFETLKASNRSFSN